MSIEEYDYPKPTAPFPYTMRTTSVLEHSRGIMWVATLLRDGEEIGEIEQMGDGGPDRVIIDDAQDRALWDEHIKSAFDSEESATFYLLCEEEG